MFADEVILLYFVLEVYVPPCKQLILQQTSSRYCYNAFFLQRKLRAPRCFTGTSDFLVRNWGSHSALLRELYYWSAHHKGCYKGQGWDAYCKVSGLDAELGAPLSTPAPQTSTWPLSECFPEPHPPVFVFSRESWLHRHDWSMLDHVAWWLAIKCDLMPTASRVGASEACLLSFYPASPGSLPCGRGWDSTPGNGSLGPHYWTWQVRWQISLWEQPQGRARWEKIRFQWPTMRRQKSRSKEDRDQRANFLRPYMLIIILVPWKIQFMEIIRNHRWSLWSTMRVFHRMLIISTSWSAQFI